MSVKVPKNYECPLCTCCTGKQELFFYSKIIDAPICQACSTELDVLIEANERPDEPLLDRIEEITGLTYREYKIIGYEQILETYESLKKPETFFKDSKEIFEVTGKSPKDIMDHYRNVVSHYRNELKKLNRIDREDET